MIMCVLLCYPVSIRIYYQQGGLFLVKIYIQSQVDMISLNYFPLVSGRTLSVTVGP